jgi:glycosyltransferase involved in cell wall biosynthesis
MKFSIVTPSFNQLSYLKRCVASVADQQGVDVEHIVIDGGSTDGTARFLEEFQSNHESRITNHGPAYTFSYSSERDAGMYDALNKGFARASGDICAWLNCDEQYLPDALQEVARYFAGHPEADIAYGDALLIAPDGCLITCRKNPPLRRAYVLADHLYTQSAAMFFRAEIFSSGHSFNTAWKAVGDCDFVSRVLSAGFCPGQIKEYLAACSMTGENLSRQKGGVQELLAFRQTAPMQYRIGRAGWNLLRYTEKFLRGGYYQAAPLEYDLYSENSNVREKFAAQKADVRFRWDSRE